MPIWCSDTYDGRRFYFLHWTLEQTSKRTDEDDMKSCLRHCIDISMYGFAEGDKQNIHSIYIYAPFPWRTYIQCTLLLHSVTVESCIHPRSSACCIEYKWQDRIPAAVIRLSSAAVNFWCRENPGQSAGFEADTTRPCHHISFIQSSR